MPDETAPAGDDVVAAFHPLVAGWFRARFGAPTAPQVAGWPRITAGEDVLIAAPTGSGKTLAAFLACLDVLIRRGLANPLSDHTSILYISPLKALSNDVQRNLEAPLAELAVHAATQGVRLPEIRVAVHTGDTSTSERAKLARRPAHILVTTPESLYILLTTVKGRAALGQLRTVIVDEIHATAGDERGAHLALSLERLDRLVHQASGRTRINSRGDLRLVPRSTRLGARPHATFPLRQCETSGIRCPRRARARTTSVFAVRTPPDIHPSSDRSPSVFDAIALGVDLSWVAAEGVATRADKRVGVTVITCSNDAGEAHGCRHCRGRRARCVRR